ncbi:MAG: helix-turn-helix transcriptional regulator [Alkalimonas sp.]|nr:helix-turn-helix transcriptional regulator [Alkalimonas sp.]
MTKSTKLLTPNDLTEMGLLSAPAGAGAHFYDFIQRKNLTAADAARDLGVAKSTITRLINGESELTVSLAAKMQRVYNAPVELFFRLDAKHKAYKVKQLVEMEAMT